EMVGRRQVGVARDLESPVERRARREARVAPGGWRRYTGECDARRAVTPRDTIRGPVAPRGIEQLVLVREGLERHARDGVVVRGLCDPQQRQGYAGLTVRQAGDGLGRDRAPGRLPGYARREQLRSTPRS